MAITEGTQPSAVHATGQNGTTGSFTPEKGSLLAALFAVDGVSGTATTVVVSDSTGGSWTLLKRQNTNTAGIGGSAEIWIRDIGSNPVSMTVTGDWSVGGGANGGNIVVRTLLGALPVAQQTGATGGAGGSSIPPTCSLSPTQIGSRIYGAGLDWTTNASLTDNANTTSIDQFLDATNGDTWATYKAAVDTASTSSTTYGWTNANAAYNVAAAEILAAPAGGSPGLASLPPHLIIELAARNQAMWLGNPAPSAVVSASTPGPLVVAPQQAWPPITAPVVSASQPLGNPAVPTPQPLVVGPTYVRPPVPPALIFGPGAVATTGGALVVSPPFVPVPIPAVSFTSSFPLGNPAVGTASALVVSTPFAAKVPGALIFGPGAPPPPVSTVASPQPLVIGPPNVPVPIPVNYITNSEPLGNPAVGSPQPLVIGPPFRPVPVPEVLISSAPPAGSPTTPGPLVVSTFTLAPVPGAKVFTAPAGAPAPQPLVISRSLWPAQIFLPLLLRSPLAGAAAGPIRDLVLAAAAPEAKWLAGAAEPRWAVALPEPKWLAGNPDLRARWAASAPEGRWAAGPPKV